jgi:hypothetical protein
VVRSLLGHLSWTARRHDDGTWRRDPTQRRLLAHVTEATAMLERVQADLHPALGAAGVAVDWPRLLARVEVANRRLQQMIALLEGHHS